MRDLTKLAKLGFVVGAMMLAGCSGLHLHSPIREAQAKAAQKTWSDADTQTVVKVERENSAAILKRELAQTEDAVTVSRDARLLAVVLGSLKTNLIDPVKARSDALGDGAFLAGLQKAQGREKFFASSMQSAQAEIESSGFKPFPCKDLVSGKAQKDVNDWLVLERTTNPKNAMNFEGALDTAAKICKPWPVTAAQPKLDVEVSVEDSTASRTYVAQQLGATPEAAKQPTLLKQMAALHVAEDAFAAKKGVATAGDRNAYRAALLAYQRILSSSDRNQPASQPTKPADGAAAEPRADAASAATTQPKTKLDEALEKLEGAIAQLKKNQDKLNLQLLAEERIDAVSDVLDTLQNPKALDDPKATDKDRAATALRRLYVTFEKLKDANVSAQEVLQRPLTTQRAIDQLQVEAIERALAMAEAELSLQRQDVEVSMQQAVQFRDAQALISQGVSNSGLTLAEAMSDEKISSAERARLVDATSRYGYAVGHLQAQRNQISLKQSALVHENSLLVSENSLKQWQALIGDNVELLASWASTGVTAETISRGINALLLLWIGIGVN